jgi:hypothetical protein
MAMGRTELVCLVLGETLSPATRPRVERNGSGTGGQMAARETGFPPLLELTS